MLEGAGWRWGYGMFAILVPAALAPLIGTLVWAEWAARRRGYIVKSVSVVCFFTLFPSLCSFLPHFLPSAIPPRRAGRTEGRKEGLEKE